MFTARHHCIEASLFIGQHALAEVADTIWEEVAPKWSYQNLFQGYIHPYDASAQERLILLFAQMRANYVCQGTGMLLTRLTFPVTTYEVFPWNPGPEPVLEALKGCVSPHSFITGYTEVYGESDLTTLPPQYWQLRFSETTSWYERGTLLLPPDEGFYVGRGAA